jgi:hypothetical protein
VVTTMTLLKRMLWRYQGHVGAALVLGGVDATGAHLYTIYPHGSTDKLPYATMGSGSLAAMAIFEAGWKPDMERAEAMELVHQVCSSCVFASCIRVLVLTRQRRRVRRPSFRVSSTIWVLVRTWTWWCLRRARWIFTAAMTSPTPASTTASEATTSLAAARVRAAPLPWLFASDANNASCVLSVSCSRSLAADRAANL